MMSKEDQEVLNVFAGRIRKLYAEARIWAFGSRTRGSAEWDSDFDICIVLPRVDRIATQAIRRVAWEVGFDRDRVITTIIMEEDQFETGPMSESTIVEHILREGVAA
jgi:predicted nucleotidyltransferase